MKKIKIIIASSVVFLVICVLVVAALFVCGSSVNKNNLKKMMTRFEEKTVSFDGVHIVEKQSVYGKLNGNGNGIQYFGAFLLENDTSVDWDNLKNELEDEFEVVEYMKPDSSVISSKYLEHEELVFETVIDDENQNEYVVIYFFNSHSENSGMLDVKGY